MPIKPIIPFEPVITESINEGEQWIAQVKWDGVRVLIYYDGNVVRLFNRKKDERTLHCNVYCDDILNQMSAVQSALHSVSRLLLESHMNTCVIERLKEEDPDIVAEFMKTISKIMK